MKNSIAIFVLSFLGLSVFGQASENIDTLRFTADSSYSRSIVRYQGNLVFGTSKTGVIAWNESTRTAQTLIPSNRAGEFRDLLVSKNCLFAITSGSDGILFKYHPKRGVQELTHEKGAFYDDIAILKSQIAILADPVNMQFNLKLWHERSAQFQSIAITSYPEEACYAASGTTAQFLPGGDYVFVSGGSSSVRFFRFNWKDTTHVTSVNLPLAKAEGAGPFSVFFWNDVEGVCVGGNYTKPHDAEGTACYTRDGGKTWFPSSTSGYRSCVTGNDRLLLACGSNGIDYSQDGGKTWKSFQSGNFCALLLENKVLYATTNKGYCLRFELPKSFFKP